MKASRLIPIGRRGCNPKRETKTREGGKAKREGLSLGSLKGGSPPDRNRASSRMCFFRHPSRSAASKGNGAAEAKPKAKSISQPKGGMSGAPSINEGAPKLRKRREIKKFSTIQKLKKSNNKTLQHQHQTQHQQPQHMNKHAPAPGRGTLHSHRRLHQSDPRGHGTTAHQTDELLLIAGPEVKQATSRRLTKEREVYIRHSSNHV